MNGSGVAKQNSKRRARTVALRPPHAKKGRSTPTLNLEVMLRGLGARQEKGFTGDGGNDVAVKCGELWSLTGKSVSQGGSGSEDNIKTKEVHP